MNIFESPYIKHNKWLLSCCGLWPYQPRFQKLTTFLFSVISMWCLTIPLIDGLPDESRIVIKFETLVTLITVFGGFLQILKLYVLELQIKKLYENINSDWQSLTNEKELKILHKFSREGRRLIFIFAASTCGCYFLFIIFTYVPLFIYGETSNPNDYSKHYPYYSNRWIINNNLRNLQVLIHSTLVVFYGGSVYIAVIGTYICCVKHFCGMFAIIRYKLKKIIPANQMEPLNGLIDDQGIILELFEIIEEHKRIIRGIRLLMRIFGRTFFIAEICCLICLASLIFDVKYHIHQTRLMIRILFTAIIFIIELFYINYGSEQIMRFSNEIYLTTHDIKWYLLSVKARKILLMIIRRTARPENLNYGHMTLSLENFAWTIRTSWSLATVIFATHQKGLSSTGI